MALLLPFKQKLIELGFDLVRGTTSTLQVNLGLRCNQMCRHCHLSAGPHRMENMTAETTGEVIAYARTGGFEVIDITGGAPELNPNLVGLIEGVHPFIQRIILRSNLSVLIDGVWDHLIGLLKDKMVVIIASFPSVNGSQTDSQRGQGIFQQSIDVLRKLNAVGYGEKGSGLELNLASNPSGAFLAASQTQTEDRFRHILMEKWGIVFNKLLCFSNVPEGRFRQWLMRSGNLETYKEKLASAFNPCAVEKLMCRSLVSISWDGYLYDCDFNLASAIPMAGRRTHISEMTGPPEPGSPIAVSDNCYTCTAGAGFT